MATPGPGRRIHVVLWAMRECGGCTACCTIMRVASLGKERLQRCQHVTDTGCSIYASRPGECGTFKCTWLASPELSDAMRPDQSGMMVWSEPAPFGVIAGDERQPIIFWAEETRPGGLDTYWAQKMLKILARNYVILGIRYGQLHMDPDGGTIYGRPDLVSEARRFFATGQAKIEL